MKESIILGTGNSRYLKSSIAEATTWEEFRDALIAGTLPVDLAGINEAGFQQMGDPLNKKTLLEDATAALYGLADTAVPDEIFAAIRPLIATAQETADSRAKIAYGTYTGTGTYDVDNPNRLTFGFEPQLVIVQSSASVAFDSPNSSDVKKAMLIMLRSLGVVYLSQATMAVQVAWAGNDVSWYSTYGASYQLNIAENTYNYFALG